MTFAAIVNKVVKHMRRPDAVIGEVAKDAVNSARDFAQRHREFNAAKAFVPLTYTGGANTVPLATRVRRVHAVGHKLESGQFGDEIKLVPALYALEIKGTGREVAYFVGEELALRPMPPDNTELLLLATKWLPLLVDDNDTDFFLFYGWDFILYKALQYCNMYVKEDERIAVSTALLSAHWVSLVEWDASSFDASGASSFDS